MNLYAAYCNLKIRPERNDCMIEELKRVGIEMERIESFPWKELWDNASEEDRHRYSFMHDKRKTPGAIGCWESQIEILKCALSQGKNAWVNEDDLLFCDDMQERLKIIFEFLEGKDWDVFWLGGTFHKDAVWHKLDENGKHTNPELQMCTCQLNRDYEEIGHPYIVRTYGAFSTMSYIVNVDKIQKHLDLMYRDMHFSMGVDWWYILRQPEMNCFAFDPGCVRQYNSYSNIGNGMANHDGFEYSCGKYFFQRKMDYVK